MTIEDTIRIVLGIIGNVISFYIFLAPAKTFYMIVKWRDSRGYPGHLHLMRIMNSALWALYGLPVVKPNTVLVSTINGIGLGIEIIYIGIFFIFWRDRKAKLRLGVLIVLTFTYYAYIILFSVLSYPSHKERYTAVGAACIVTSVLSDLPQLSIMRKVIREKCVKCLPLQLALAMFAKGLIWTAYGAIDFDIFLVLANGFEAGLGVCHLLLYVLYYKSTEWGDDDQKDVETGKKKKRL